MSNSKTFIFLFCAKRREKKKTKTQIRIGAIGSNSYEVSTMFRKLDADAGLLKVFEFDSHHRDTQLIQLSISAASL